MSLGRTVIPESPEKRFVIRIEREQKYLNGRKKALLETVAFIDWKLKSNQEFLESQKK